MKNLRKIVFMISFIVLFIVLFSYSSKMFAQNQIGDSNKLKMFEGEWKLKDNVWKSKSDSVYNEDVNPNRSFIAKAVSSENTILWNADFGNGAWAILLWTYHKQTGRVNHISNTTDNNVGIGEGQFDNNNDLKIKIVYPNGCTSCYRVYTYHWVNQNEFDFKATIYQDNRPTGDFYGGTFLRKNENMVYSVDVGVNVSDSVRSLAFYTKVLGMKRIGTWHASREMSAMAGVNSGRAFDVIDLNLMCDGYILKYKLNQTENNTDTTTDRESQTYSFEKLGARYLTINVKSVDPFLERIKENNIKYKLVTLPNERRVVLLHDPDGALLEISGN
jgi:catechol 2,3-dioxygenase-like lactoylglutathione lyase family enzyme